MNLSGAADEAVWTHARDNDLIVVSKDAMDFLRAHHGTIRDFVEDEEAAFLMLAPDA